MSFPDNHNEEASCWGSFLRVFCCIPTASSNNVVTKETSSSSTSVASRSNPELQMDTIEEPIYPAVIYDKPTQHPHLSITLETTSITRPDTIILSDKEPASQALSSPAFLVPEKPKKGHRRWSSVLSLMAGSHPMEHEKRFTMRGFHFPRNRAPKHTDSFHENDSLPSPQLTENGRPRASSAPEEATVHFASAAAIIKIGRLQKKANPTIQEQTQDYDNELLSPTMPIHNLPPQPHTPPFPGPRMTMMPLPPPLPATLKPVAKKRKSLSQVSYWLTRTQLAPVPTADAVPATPDPMSVKAMINQCFSQADPHCSRFSEGSITTVGTWYTEDSRNIFSAGSRNSMETKGDEYRYSRKCSTGGTYKPSPLASVGVAV